MKEAPDNAAQRGAAPGGASGLGELFSASGRQNGDWIGYFRSSRWRNDHLVRDTCMSWHSLFPVSTVAGGVLIVGCGDIGMRVLRILAGGSPQRVVVLTSSPSRRAVLREAGAVPLVGDLDRPGTLVRLAGLCRRVLYLAPPDASRAGDPRCAALCQALARRTPPAAFVYASTTGVYGDCQGEWLDETRPVHPETARAARRVAAEAVVREFGRMTGARVSILRVPGIYALDRPGGSPVERLTRSAPVLAASDDVYTQHIHADDLARACVAALYRGCGQRVVNVVDGSDIRMGDYFDLAADLAGLPRPPRLTREEVQRQLTPMQWSFIRESRRMGNHRLVKELKMKLRFPTVRHGLALLGEG